MTIEQLKSSQFGFRLVRGLNALAFTGAVIYGFLTDRVSADVFLPMAGTAIGFYFSQRPGTDPK